MPKFCDLGVEKGYKYIMFSCFSDLEILRNYKTTSFNEIDADYTRA